MWPSQHLVRYHVMTGDRLIIEFRLTQYQEYQKILAEFPPIIDVYLEFSATRTINTEFQP